MICLFHKHLRYEIVWRYASAFRVNATELTFIVVDKLSRLLFVYIESICLYKWTHFIRSIPFYLLM